MSKIIRLNFEESKIMMDTDPAVVIADVREENEFATGFVENAINMPLTELIDVPEEEGRLFAESLVPDRSTPVMVYCRTGRRSAMAAEALVKFGYQNVYDMGGLSKWPYPLDY